MNTAFLNYLNRGDMEDIFKMEKQTAEREKALRHWEEKMTEYKERYTEWVEGGKRGDAPPRPVRPHLVGRGY